MDYAQVNIFFQASGRAMALAMPGKSPATLKAFLKAPAMKFPGISYT
jgi:hypothetical protein